MRFDRLLEVIGHLFGNHHSRQMGIGPHHGGHDRGVDDAMEWRGKRVGTLGAAGCYSFQASKNLNCGEGGAVLTSDGELLERAYAFHNNSRGRAMPGSAFNYATRGANLRLTEFQAAILLAQMERLEGQSRVREQNAAHLTSLLREIPGITPASTHPGCTRNAFHLYMFRYNAEAFAGAPRQAFLKALTAEGVPCSGGYSPLNREPFLENAIGSAAYSKIYGAETIATWRERNQCPQNDKLCREAVWLSQTMLLGSRSDMEQIAEAVRKIQRESASLSKA